VGQVVLCCVKRSEQRKTQLAVCLRKQNPAGAGLGVSLIEYKENPLTFWGGLII